uniref:Uncharacterized protein n=1 Tax=Meloidogyne enterolobii TaxID=390850 RepID=A0A6V7TYG0_MELEN|nr:unnamed protein product [Meloidogyne enterolobii]
MVFRPYGFSIFRGLYLSQIKSDFFILVSFDTLDELLMKNKEKGKERWKNRKRRGRKPKNYRNASFLGFLILFSGYLSKKSV